jgi:hypothetical protein
MSNSHARLVRALVFACLFPLSAIAFAGSAKTTVAADGLAQNATGYGGGPPQAALAPGNANAPIAVR